MKKYRILMGLFSLFAICAFSSSVRAEIQRILPTTQNAKTQTKKWNYVAQ